MVSSAELKKQTEDRDSVRKILEVTTAKRRVGISDYKYHVT